MALIAQEIAQSTPLIEEQAEFAAIIIVGKVYKQIFSLDNVEAIELKEVSYYKGSGPEAVVIRGFGTKNPGQLPMPFLESTVVIFGCESSSKDFPVKINDYVSYAGILTVTNSVRDFLSSNFVLRRPSTPLVFEKCGTKASGYIPSGVYGFS